MKREMLETKEVIQIIENARNNTYRKVNEELILMYWNVGQYLSNKMKNNTYGDPYVENLSKSIQNSFPRH